MARAVSDNWITAASARVSRPRWFFEGTFASSTINFWTGALDVVWDSKTWIANGYLQNPGTISESIEISASTIEIVLAGVPTEQIAFALEETFINQPMRLWLGFVDESESNIIANCEVARGRLDVCQYVRSSQTTTLQLSYESRMIDLDRTPACRYTDANQKSFYPSDRGFEYVSRLANWSANWGAATTRNFKRTTHPKRASADQIG